MRRGRALAAGLLACALFGPAFAAGGHSLWQPAGRPSDQRVQADADVVELDVIVTRDRRPVPGLTSADFVLLDNGVVQRVEAVAGEAAPMTLLIALDTSATVSGKLLSELKLATDAAVAALRAEDRFGLLTFSQKVRMRVPPPAAPRPVAGDLERIEPNGDTALYDAAIAAMVARRPSHGRTVVLVFSDGVDTASWLDPRDVLRVARESDVTVFGVTAPRDASPGRFLLGGESLQREWFPKEPDLFPGGFLPLLAEETGGAVFPADDFGRLRDQFVRVVESYRSRYVLSYSPVGVASRGWHEVEVRLNNRRGDVQVRRGHQH